MEQGYLIGFIISLVFIGLGFIAGVIGLLDYLIYSEPGKKRMISSLPYFQFFFGSVVLASIAILFPIYINKFNEAGYGNNWFEALFLSFQNTLRFFVIDEDFSTIFEPTSLFNDKAFAQAYNALGTVLLVLAPIFTFGFVLTFFSNLHAFLRYKFSFLRDTYIFSELNRKSILLAEDIRRKHHYFISIVFAGVTREMLESDDELVERAREIKAIIFKKEITALTFRCHPAISNVHLFFMNLNQDDAVRDYYTIFKEEKMRKNFKLYLFATSSESQLALNHPDNHLIKTAHVTIDNSFIYRYLFFKGKEIFDSAVKLDEEGNKIISVVIVGLGRYGKQILMALAWFCQMDGYRLKINAFDTDKNAFSNFAALCPELVDERLNGKVIEGDAYYDIHIHPDCTLKTTKFNEILKTIDDASIAYACLGDDEKNIEAALELRMQFERNKIHPVINAVVQDVEDDILIGAANHRGEKYDIKFIGDNKSSYSYDAIIDSKFEKIARGVNESYGGNDVSFDTFEYTYRSSCASAIHTKMKLECGIKGITMSKDEIMKDRKIYRETAILEHKRWNAWMRSEGYVYSGSTNRASRNELAKKHHDIVPFDELSSQEKDKDIEVITGAVSAIREMEEEFYKEIVNKSDKKRDTYQLDKGKQAKNGYDWWWHSLTGINEKTGEKKQFYIEFFITNPKLAQDKPVFGQLKENKEKGIKPSYLMINVGTWGKDKAQLHNFYSIKDVQIQKGKDFAIEINNNLLNETYTKGCVKVTKEEAAAHPEYMSDAGEMSWELNIKKRIAFNVGYGASSLFRRLQLFEMFWHAEGMKTHYDGYIIYNGEKYLVTHELCNGYADKNWGKDFTSPWVWLSSNDLFSTLNNVKLENSVFDIGGGRPKMGPIVFKRQLLSSLYHEGKYYEFNFSKFLTHPKTTFECKEGENEITWHIEQSASRNKMIVDMTCLKEDMLLINYEAPNGKKLHNRLWNGGNGKGRIQLFHKGELIDDIKVNNAGCEYGEYSE